MILVTLVDFVSEEKKSNIRWEYNRIDAPLTISYTGIHSYCWEDSKTNVTKGKILTLKRNKTIRRKKTQILLLTIHLQNTENWYRIQKKDV